MNDRVSHVCPRCIRSVRAYESALRHRKVAPDFSPTRFLEYSQTIRPSEATRLTLLQRDAFGMPVETRPEPYLPPIISPQRSKL